MIPDETVRLINRFLNLCENDNGSPENDYGTVYRYKDGNNKRRQVTLSKGFTEDGGNLRKVVDLYLRKGGQSAVLKSRVDKIGRGVLADDAEFVKALSKAASESVMREAQDEVFRTAYLNPALAWAASRGFAEPLSYAITVDSFLHSGRMTPFLVNSFAERPPSMGGDEQAWMRAYCEARLAWFQRAAGALRTCVFRPSFFLAQMEANNWSFACPLRLPGKGTIC